MIHNADSPFRVRNFGGAVLIALSCASVQAQSTPAMPSAAARPAATATTPVATPRDSIDTDECKLARRELTLAQSARPPESRSPRDNREADLPRVAGTDKARDRVAIACFGRSADSAIPGRSATGPIAVPPVVTESGNLRAGAPNTTLSPTLAPPPVDVPRPAAITSCDAGGCFDSNGQRYSGSGPVLSGPKGPCTAQAGFVTCN